MFEWLNGGRETIGAWYSYLYLACILTSGTCYMDEGMYRIIHPLISTSISSKADQGKTSERSLNEVAQFAHGVSTSKDEAFRKNCLILQIIVWSVILPPSRCCGCDMKVQCFLQKRGSRSAKRQKADRECGVPRNAASCRTRFRGSMKNTL